LTENSFWLLLARGLGHDASVIKPKKKRKGDANQVAHGIVQDVIKLSEKPIKPPSKPPNRK
jgi:hypothetical protein